MRLFTFVQMEIPWELGPADGRYLLRKLDGPRESEPEHVVVLNTVGATRKSRLGRRSHTRATDPEPAPVAVTRATVVDPVSLSSESQAKAWLGELDPDREAVAAVGAINRMLFAHRIAGAAQHLHEIAPTQALVIRAGYGEGEQVADGLWVKARELVLSHKRAGRRAAALRPHERLALLLSGRDRALRCEELVLRARLDFDGGRMALAAIELERAYTAALVELPGEEREDMRARVQELAARSGDLEEAATVALGPAGREEIDVEAVRNGLERLEAALRARTAPGFAALR